MTDSLRERIAEALKKPMRGYVGANAALAADVRGAKPADPAKHFNAAADAVLAEFRAYLVSNEERLVEAGARAIERSYKDPPCDTCEGTGELPNWVTGDWTPCYACADAEAPPARAALRAFVASLFPENREEE